MSFLASLFTEVIYRPLLNGLVLIYVALPLADLGLAIVGMTALVRLLLHPAMVQAIRSQQAMGRVQPKLREIQERFKGNREEQARRTMALYREEGVHPLSGCLPLLIQLPALIGLYRVFWKGITLQDPALFYSFVPHIAAFNPVAFGLFDLTGRSVVLALAAGVAQFFQGKFATPPGSTEPGMGAEFNRALRLQMTYFFPFFIAVISWSLPSALALYWTAFSIFAIVEQRWIERRIKHERDLRAHQRDA